MLHLEAAAAAPLEDALIGSIQWSAFIPRAELSGDPRRPLRLRLGDVRRAPRLRLPFGANGTRTFRPSCDARVRCCRCRTRRAPATSSAARCCAGSHRRRDQRLGRRRGGGARPRALPVAEVRGHDDGVLADGGESRVTYVNIGFWQHDLVCDSRTEERGLAQGRLPAAARQLLAARPQPEVWRLRVRVRADGEPDAQVRPPRGASAAAASGRADLDRPIVRSATRAAALVARAAALARARARGLGAGGRGRFAQKVLADRSISRNTPEKKTARLSRAPSCAARAAAQTAATRTATREGLELGRRRALRATAAVAVGRADRPRRRCGRRRRQCRGGRPRRAASRASTAGAARASARGPSPAGARGGPAAPR